MAGGYRAQPRNGFEDSRARQAATTRALAAARTAASLRSSSISGGKGLTVGADGAGKVKVYNDPVDGLGTIAFTSADDPTRGAALRGDPSTDIGYLQITSPGDLDDPNHLDPTQSYLTLASRSSVGVGPSMNIQAGGALVQLWDYDGLNAEPNVTVQGTLFKSQSNGDSIIRANASSLVFPAGISEVRVRDQLNTAYAVIRASAFTVTSSREAKDQVTDFGWSPLEVVRRAKAKRWHYRPEHGDPDRVHFGPMAEDLPDDLVDNTSETPAIDLAAMVGVLWGAVQELAAEVAELRAAAC
jgi:hypothetical protein